MLRSYAVLFAQMGPIPRARRQHGDLSGSCCCSLLSARAVAARLAIRPSIIRCIVEHRSAVSTGLVRAICSIIHSAAAAELAVDQVRVPQLRGAPRSACALKTGCRRPLLRPLVCSGARRGSLRSGAPVHRRVEARLRRSCASRLVPRRLVCCLLCGHVNQSTNPFDDNHVAAQCMRTLRHVALL